VKSGKGEKERKNEMTERLSEDEAWGSYEWMGNVGKERAADGWRGVGVRGLRRG
jgi:hypothetical protein